MATFVLEEAEDSRRVDLRMRGDSSMVVVLCSPDFRYMRDKTLMPWSGAT